MVPLCAAALEVTIRRAVAFGVAWGALSAMEKHQLGAGVLDVGEATGVSAVHSCDSQVGVASQQEAEESFLRNIDQRCVAEMLPGCFVVVRCSFIVWKCTLFLPDFSRRTAMHQAVSRGLQFLSSCIARTLTEQKYPGIADRDS